MKKLTALILAAALLTALCACGAKTDEPTQTGYAGIETTPENTEQMTARTGNTMSESAQDDAQEHYGANAENLAEMMHKVASYAPGTAGASLKKAEAAFEVLKYAVVHNIYVLDEDYLESILRKAKFDLDLEEKARIDDYLDDDGTNNVYALVMQALNDYDSVKSQFEDAGAAEMSDYVYSVRAAESFEKLADEIEDTNT